MMAELEVRTKGELDIVKITEKVQEIVSKSSLRRGLVVLFLKSTTSALFINEDEEGLKGDLRRILEVLVPRRGEYGHNKAWGEENAHSHLRSILLGNSLTIPFEDGRLALGTWQDIFLMELDIRPRVRKISISILPLG